MNKVLFVNTCVRRGSRTLELAEKVLERLKAPYDEVNPSKEKMQPLDEKSLALRDEMSRQGNFSHPCFSYAKQFAKAETIVIAAPYWDLSFPALLKIYMEAVTVAGITFTYENNRPKGLCRCKRLIYVTTSGGYISDDFGFSYIKALAESFYGIPCVEKFSAEGLDIWGNSVSEIMDAAKTEIQNRIAE